MSFRSRCVPLLLLTFCATTLVGQTRTLNPPVRVLPRAASPVPAECEEGVLAQPAQRVQREDLPEVQDVRRDLEPPPSRDLRGHLQTAHNAAVANDRETFRQSLAAAKQLLATYPQGGERTAAAAVVTVYDDLDRFWEYQLTSPIGSFFDAGAQGGALLSAMRKYPRYEEFIRRQTIVDSNGNRFYPTRETRDFLIQEAANRLSALGLRVAVPRTVARPPIPEPAPRAQPSVQPGRPAPQPTAVTQRATRQPERRTQRRATPSPSTRTTRERPTATAAAPPTPAPPRVAIATDTALEEPPPPPVVVDTTPVTETIPPATAIATETEAAAPAEEPAPKRTRGIILPLMLILIGIGVLIVLFRASS